MPLIQALMNKRRNIKTIYVYLTINKWTKTHDWDVMNSIYFIINVCVCVTDRDLVTVAILGSATTSTTAIGDAIFVSVKHGKTLYVTQSTAFKVILSDFVIKFPANTLLLAFFARFHFFRDWVQRRTTFHLDYVVISIFRMWCQQNVYTAVRISIYKHSIHITHIDRMKKKADRDLDRLFRILWNCLICCCYTFDVPYENERANEMKLCRF